MIMNNEQLLTQQIIVAKQATAEIADHDEEAVRNLYINIIVEKLRTKEKYQKILPALLRTSNLLTKIYVFIAQGDRYYSSIEAGLDQYLKDMGLV